jgi:hypothetical protein
VGVSTPRRQEFERTVRAFQEIFGGVTSVTGRPATAHRKNFGSIESWLDGLPPLTRTCARNVQDSQDFLGCLGRFIWDWHGPSLYYILGAVNTRHSAAFAPSLNGRKFVMESSTNSVVDAISPSHFRYFERDGVVWGDYDGDTVIFGHFVGTRVGNDLRVSFVHVLVACGGVVTGTGGSVVESLLGGAVRLVEHFQIDGTDHVSICVQV